jgi:hypothetical protein
LIIPNTANAINELTTMAFTIALRRLLRSNLVLGSIVHYQANKKLVPGTI